MKRILILVLLLLGTFSIVSFAVVHVKEYTRSNGTVVPAHTRSDPNSTVTDNYTFKGNINPDTGEEGHNHYRNDPSSPFYNSGGDASNLNINLNNNNIKSYNLDRNFGAIDNSPMVPPIQSEPVVYEPTETNTPIVFDKPIATPPITGQYYKVIVGSYKQSSAAKATVSSIKKGGLQAFVNTSKAGLYRVQAGAFSSMSAATSLRAKLKAKGYNPGIILE